MNPGTAIKVALGLNRLRFTRHAYTVPSIPAISTMTIPRQNGINARVVRNASDRSAGTD